MSESGRNQGEEMERSETSEMPIECDFCHQAAPRVQRVALDGEYERLQTPHAVQYACLDCFEKKNRQRMGV
ncbi:MAG: hypothetical protein CBC48_06210 [bacterium TMED88]|nr:hypothetical protein [Deltaproteobacteria bacterium]OUV34131.1 MAG: hypothetical protein CBC48_06210 [bacterium TMED88]